MTRHILGVRRAGLNHQVVTVKSTSEVKPYRRQPCATCPWRKDAAGLFPPEAFRHSADTAYDMAENKFACHVSGIDKPTTCAGFLLRGADHNLAYRLDVSHGRIDPAEVSDGGHELHDSYRAMAVANGVSPQDPFLERCRP